MEADVAPLVEVAEDDVIAFTGLDNRIYFGLVKQVYASAVKLHWLAPKNRLIEPNQVNSFDDFNSTAESRITVEEQECVLSVVIEARFNKQAIQEIQAMQKDHVRTDSIASSFTNDMEDTRPLINIVPTELSQSNQLNLLHINATSQLITTEHFTDIISALLSSHIPLFVSMFGDTFASWLNRMHCSDADRFRLLIDGLFRAACTDIQVSFDQILLHHSVFYQSFILDDPSNKFKLILDSATRFLTMLSIDASKFGFRPVESVGQSGYFFELQGIWSNAAALTYEQGKLNSIVCQEAWPQIYGPFFPFLTMSGDRSNQQYLEFEGLVAGVVQGLTRLFVKSVVERVALDGNGGCTDCKLRVFEFVRYKIYEERNARVRRKREEIAIDNE